MISVYLVPKADVQKALKEKGCEELESPLPGHSAWRSPWGQALLVPEDGPEGQTADWKLHEIMQSIDASKPTCS